MADTPLQLLLAVGLFGFGGPMISIGAPKVIAGLFTGKNRATAMGVYMTGPLSGRAIGAGADEQCRHASGRWGLACRHAALRNHRRDHWVRLAWPCGGLFFTAAEFGGVTGPIAFGFLADLSGGFALSLISMSVVCVILLVLVAGLRREHARA